MATSFTKGSKTCAVCNYWGGPRQVDGAGMRVIVEHGNIKGQCLGQGAPFKGNPTLVGTTCRAWQAWAVLR